MLMVLFDYENGMQHESAPQGQTINELFYLQMLRRLRVAELGIPRVAISS